MLHFPLDRCPLRQGARLPLRQDVHQRTMQRSSCTMRSARLRPTPVCACSRSREVPRSWSQRQVRNHLTARLHPQNLLPRNHDPQPRPQIISHRGRPWLPSGARVCEKRKPKKGGAPNPHSAPLPIQKACQLPAQDARAAAPLGRPLVPRQVRPHRWCRRPILRASRCKFRRGP